MEVFGGTYCINSIVVFSADSGVNFHSIDLFALSQLDGVSLRGTEITLIAIRKFGSAKKWGKNCQM